MGFKKASGKGRLDKYYRLAKEKGYRARSAFKLIQLNEKYKFLEKSRVLIDLCAAPGGWLQVATEYMPMSHIIIGVDLDPIKPIKGVTTFKSDITTQKCRSEIKKELKGWKADVVLHDGAPNVGSSWDKDAHNQTELVLHSLKLASEILNEGGVFVTKIFRSSNYLKLINLLNKIFDRVDSTKPASSRNVSAEIFVVCRGFKGVQHIAPEALDPKCVFAEEVTEAPKQSLLSKTKKNRQGYEDGATMLYKEISLSDLFNHLDPETVLCSYNKVVYSKEEAELYLEGDKKEELEGILSDLKLVAKKDLILVLKWIKRKKLQLNPKIEEEVEVEAEVVDPFILAQNEEAKYKKDLKKKIKKQKLKLSKNQLQSAADIADDMQLETEEDGAFNEWFSKNVSSQIVSDQKGEDCTVEKPKKKKTLDANIDPVLLSHLASMPRSELIEDSFGKYSRSKEEKSLPDWFIEDEKLHNVKQIPITKEEVDKIKARIREEKNALPKKVMEAKQRQKFRALRKLDSLKKKASILDESERIEDKEKLRSILSNIYKKQTSARKKKIVVAKGRLKGVKGRPGGVRGRYKMLDSRMRKDERNKKLSLRKKK